MKPVVAKLLNYSIGVAAVLFPAFLLYPINRFFYLDWTNNVWMVGYFGEHFRRHGWMPEAFNTPECPGLAYPVFYGYLLYPILGLASAGLGPQVALRLAVLLLFAAQFLSVRQAFRRLGAASAFASGAACLVVWATYALTNLYNRSALAEFFAIGFLTCAVSGWFGVLGAKYSGALWRRGLRVGFCFALAAGTHPITALLSLPLVVVLLTALALRTDGPSRMARLVCLAAAGTLAAVVLAPWWYALCLFRTDLAITPPPGHELDVVYAYFFPDSIDKWTTRLFPLPLDVRCLSADPKEVSTPYLDAQINVPLLVLCAAALFRLLAPLERWQRLRAAAFLALPLAYTALALALSLRRDLYKHLPSLVGMVQFPYRWVSFVNLGLLSVLLFALHAARGRRAAPSVLQPLASPVLLCFILTLAGAGVVVKLIHAASACWESPPARVCDSRPYLSHLPVLFYGYSSYATPRRLRPLPGTEEPPFLPLCSDSPGEFGRTTPRTVLSERPGFVGTDVAVFPWNRFWVDGRLVPEDALCRWYSPRLDPWAIERVAVPVSAGQHVIEHQFVPDRMWRRLHRLSTVVLASWAAALVCLGAARRLTRRRSGRETPLGSRTAGPPAATRAAA